MKYPSSLLLTSLAALAIGSTALAEPKKNIVETAVAAGSFKTLAAALEAGGLVDALQGEGPFTVFAPTDDAFAKLPEGTIATLLKPENKDQLVDILTYHVVSGNVPSSVAVTLEKATALNEKELKIMKKDEGLFLNDSKVVTADIECSNGVIHVIDSVLLPPADEKAETSATTTAARDLVAMAIRKGAPLFNHGQHQACAAIYEVTAAALMTMQEGSVSAADRKMLENAMMKVSHSHCSATNAWTIRSAFDAMLVAKH